MVKDTNTATNSANRTNKESILSMRRALGNSPSHLLMGKYKFKLLPAFSLIHSTQATTELGPCQCPGYRYYRIITSSSLSSTTLISSTGP